MVDDNDLRKDAPRKCIMLQYIYIVKVKFKRKLPTEGKRENEKNIFNVVKRYFVQQKGKFRIQAANGFTINF